MMQSMIRLPFWSICLVFPAAAAVGAETPESRPASAPASQPASRPALDPVVERILDRLEAKGKTISDIKAKLQYTKVDPNVTSKQVYTGFLLFKEGQPNPRFFIQFDSHDVDGFVQKDKEYHVFDGQFYIEARAATQTITKHEVVDPKNPREVFKLGQGPFPLPFGQKKADIVKHFTVKLIPPAAGDPPNTDHLECTPIPGTELANKYGAVHFWVDRKLDLPVMMRTVQKEDEMEITARFSNLEVNSGFAGSELNLPSLPGYNVVVDQPDKSGKEGKQDADK